MEITIREIIVSIAIVAVMMLFGFMISDSINDAQLDKLQEYKKYDGIIINPAAYTHTSVAIHDALEIIDILKVEVHLSEVDNREEYRKVNFVRDVCDMSYQGEKEGSYLKALQYLKNKLNVL